MTLHLLYHTKPQYLWCHIHFTHHITPLYQTLHPLYLCHHNLSTDIKLTFEWNHTHLLCDIICTIYITTSNLMSSHYSTYDITTSIYKPHPVCRATYTLYMRHHSHYLCPHTHCIDNITPTLCMISHSPYVWHHFPYTRHHMLTLWPQTSLFMSSHPLYLTSCSLYLCHHIHCIDDITPTVFEITSAIIHDII